MSASAPCASVHRIAQREERTPENLAGFACRRRSTSRAGLAIKLPYEPNASQRVSPPLIAENGSPRNATSGNVRLAGNRLIRVFPECDPKNPVRRAGVSDPPGDSTLDSRTADFAREGTSPARLIW